MLMESFVAIMAMIAASIIDPGLYYAMNAPAGAGRRHRPVRRRRRSTGSASRITPGAAAQAAAARCEEQTLVAAHRRRADARHRHVADLLRRHGGEGLRAFWYHFAIMFEALFILTTVDAGTRVGRFMLQDTLGNVCKPIRATSRWKPGVWVTQRGRWSARGATSSQRASRTRSAGSTSCSRCSASPTSCWRPSRCRSACRSPPAEGPAVALDPALPLAFAAVVTIIGSLYKIFSPVPAVGYWAQNRCFRDAIAAGKTSHGTAKTPEAMDAVVRNTIDPGHAVDHLRDVGGHRHRRGGHRDRPHPARGRAPTRDRDRGPPAGGPDLRPRRLRADARGEGAGGTLGRGRAGARPRAHH